MGQRIEGSKQKQKSNKNLFIRNIKKNAEKGVDSHQHR